MHLIIVEKYVKTRKVIICEKKIYSLNFLIDYNHHANIDILNKKINTTCE